MGDEARAVFVWIALLTLAIAGGCGGESTSEPLNTQPAAESYEADLGEPPFRCETGYGSITLDFEDYDVTYCRSKEAFTSERYPVGKPVNAGCYVTETGQDVTLALRVQRDDTDIC